MILENAEIVASIPARHKHSPSYFHSFGMSEDFVIFVEQPLYVQDENRNGSTSENGPIHCNLKWRKTEMVRTRSASDVRRIGSFSFLSGF